MPCVIQDHERSFTSAFTVHFNRLQLGSRLTELDRSVEHPSGAVRALDREEVEGLGKTPPQGGEETVLPTGSSLHYSEENVVPRDEIEFTEDSHVFFRNGAV
ncbi:unnamed protein product [Dibothriocephalus latus]|uniref:Uncharacterized protein n=1 Tax=Dibothriocephalus latus TaxID=60516 RepID=A0A3P7LRX3_DIBLA|nr:unnamed protein product [Dibothriocephalus latus]